MESTKHIPTSQAPFSSRQSRTQKLLKSGCSNKIPIVRLDGDTNLTVEVEHLRQLLKRGCRHTNLATLTCLQKLSDWSLSTTSGWQAAFHVLETEEKLLAARFRVGAGRQLVAISSASRNGVLGCRKVIIEPTKDFMEPVHHRGRNWRREIWRVWDPDSSRPTIDDFFPLIVHLLEVRPRNETRTSGECSTVQVRAKRHAEANIEQEGSPLAYQYQKDGNTRLSSGEDSDIPLCQTRRGPTTSVELSDSHEDIPLSKRTRLAWMELEHSSNIHQHASAVPEQILTTSTERNLSILSIPSSDHDNKDYSYWRDCELVDHVL